MLDIINLISGFVGIVLGAIGLLYSVKAFHEAKEARIAATKAGDVVKRQSIAMEILEISHVCKLETTISLPEARSVYGDVNNRIKSIIGLYIQRPDENCKDIIEKIKLGLSDIKTQLNTFNPNEVESNENFVYYQLTDRFEILAGDLNELKGILEGQLIKS